MGAPKARAKAPKTPGAIPGDRVGGREPIEVNERRSSGRPRRETRETRRDGSAEKAAPNEGVTGSGAATSAGKSGRSGRAPNRRGSPEAIEKRRVARVFNDVLGGRGAATNKLDGRTEKRRQRLLTELEAGKARGSRELKPLDVLQHVQELMDLGEPLASIRKVAKVRKTAPTSDTLVELVARLHTAYRFRPEVYRFVGIGDDVLRAAGVTGTDGIKRRVAR